MQNQAAPLSPDWDIPPDITRLARKAAERLRAFAIKHRLTSTGGCRIFYSPKEWEKRGNGSSIHTLLVICYEGAAIKSALSFDGEDYRMMERLSKSFEKLDLYTEESTSCCSTLHLA